MRTLVALCNETILLGDDYGCGYKGKEKPSYTDALVSPDGAFFNVGPCGHDHAATQHGMVSLDRLEAEGWLHLSLEFTNYIANLSWAREFKSTTAQMNVLFDIIDDAERQNKEWSAPFITRHIEFMRSYVNNPKNCKD